MFKNDRDYDEFMKKVDKFNDKFINFLIDIFTLFWFFGSNNWDRD